PSTIYGSGRWFARPARGLLDDPAEPGHVNRTFHPTGVSPFLAGALRWQSQLSDESHEQRTTVCCCSIRVSPSQEVEMTSPLRRIRVALSLGAAIVLTCAGALSVGAQTTGVIRGKVIDGATTRPVDGAQVYVAGTELGTLTNSDGQYQFAVRAGTVEVRTRRVGYASTTKQVTVTAGQVTDADITLNKAAIALDAVVVTGTGAETEKRKLGNTVATKDAAAATLYGTEASAGVIQVFTKTGSRGSPRWDFMSEQGIVADPKNRYEDNWGFARYANLGDCVARLPDTTSTQSDCRSQPPFADALSQFYGNTVTAYTPFS